MTRRPIDDYLERLERELQQRGVEDARILAEAREHLLDAVEDGRQRGLSVDDAEHEALQRFGAPETVAAHVLPERDRTMNGFAAAFDTVWRRKWWILAPTVLTAVLTSVLSYYFLPTRYRSESLVRVSHVSADSARPTDAERSRARFREISEIVLSRTRLERIIKEFNLYQADQTPGLLDDLVQQIRRDIRIEWRAADHSEEAGVGSFNVSFVSADPILALKITQRLMGEIIDANVSESARQALADTTLGFIDSQIDETRRRIIAYEKTLETLRSQNGGRPLSRADLLPYEVLQEGYKALLLKGEQARITQSLERRTTGEQFRVIDPPGLPVRPLGPSRLAVNVAGALAGLGLGLVFVGVRSRSKEALAN
jgi:uncharacterized protein involved in exopolysaccharide biosynthesis